MRIPVIRQIDMNKKGYLDLYNCILITLNNHRCKSDAGFRTPVTFPLVQ